MEYVNYNGKKYLVNNFKLDLSGEGIKDIAQIKNLKNLTTVKSLDLWNNSISNISGFGEIPQLQELNLRDNNIVEVCGLDNLENLEVLNIANNKIKNLSGLKTLKKLKNLEIHGNQIEDINGLNKLTNLEKLGLSSNKISKISGLDSLEKLKDLYLNNNQIEKIENINHLSSLSYIDLSSNPIDEIAGFENLTNLKNIKLNNTLIKEELFTKLGGLKADLSSSYTVKEPQNLVKYCRGDYVEYQDKYFFLNGKTLELNKLRIKDISDIKRLKELDFLEHLKLANNQIKEIKNLNALVNLKSLALSSNQIEKIKNLDSLSNLEILALNDNQILEINGLDKLEKLQKLNMSNNNITKIKGLKNLQHLKQLILSGNSINSIEDLQMLKNLEYLHIASNNINKFQGLDIQINLKWLYLENNNLTSVKGIEKLSRLEILNLNNNSINDIEYITECITLKKLYLGNNKIAKFEDLGNLVNLIFLNIENNKIDANLYEILKLTDNSPRLFVSYCLLRQLIENMEKKIIWSDSIRKYPYLKGINYDELRKISSRFRYVEILINNNYEIQAIVTPECLVVELDTILEPFPENEDLSYTFLREKLKLITDKAAKEFSLYIKEKRLSKYPIYETEKGIRKLGKEQLTHQLVIYDAPNQRFFLNRSQFEFRLKQIDKFLTFNKKQSSQIYKYAFITDEIIKNNSAAINFLEQKLNWHLIYVSKDEKTTDIDAKITTFVNDLNNLYSRRWDTIHLITADHQLINFFLNTFKTTPLTNLFFITNPDEDLLTSIGELKKYDNDNLNLNIYHRA